MGQPRIRTGPHPLAYQANALPTELLGLAKMKTRKRDRNNKKQQDRKEKERYRQKRKKDRH